MKRILVILLIAATLTFVACDEDPLGDIFDIWDNETLPPSDTEFDLYDTIPPTEETTEPPTIELPLLPG